jgi:hypothetical protein
MLTSDEIAELVRTSRVLIAEMQNERALLHETRYDASYLHNLSSN